MKFSEINLKKCNYRFSANIHNRRQHYKFIMGLGKILPTTKAQAKFFIQKGICLDVLNFDDVEAIEQILNKHGFEGNYRYTKSKVWVRLQNNTDLHTALKLEYKL